MSSVSGSEWKAARVSQLRLIRSTAGQQRGTEKQTSYTPTELDSTSPPVGGLDVNLPTIPDGWSLRKAPSSSLHILVYQHVSSLCQLCTVHGKAHWKMVSKREKNISTQVTEEPKTSHLVVSQSHSPFITFHFLLWWRPGLQSKPPSPWKNLALRLSVVMDTSQVSVLPAVAPAVHCGICGSVLKKYSVGPNLVRPSTNQPTSAVYCLCERSLGTSACCPAQKKTSKSPLYCSVPNVCM